MLSDRMSGILRSGLIAFMVAAGLLGTAGGGTSESQNPGDPAGQELWVEVVDAAGAVAAAAAPFHFEVVETDQRYVARDLGEVGGSWRVVLYFDQRLTNSLDFHNATLALADRARELTRLGPVEIVLARDEVRTALPATRDADQLAQALAWLRLRENAENEQEALRRELVRSLGLELEPAAAGPAPDTGDPEETITEVLAAMAREASLLRHRGERLLSWAVDEGVSGPQALFLIGSGFDSEPADFYRSLLDQAGLPDRARDVAAPVIVPSVDEVGRVLAAYGWVALPFVPALKGDLLLVGDEDGPEAQEGRDQVDVILQDGQLVDRTVVGIDPRKLLRRRRRKKEAEARPVLHDPMAPLGLLAESTGGELVSGYLQLPDLLERLPRRRRVVYRRDSDDVAGWRHLEVFASSSGEAAGELRVRAAAWASDMTPEVVATVRARRFLADEIDEGALPISAATQFLERLDAFQLVVQLDDPSPLRPEATLRVTVISADTDDRVRVTHELRTPGSARHEEDFGVRTLTLELPLAEEPEGPIVVLVEDLASGRWGAAFASALAAGGALAAAPDSELLLLPAPKVIHLLSPRGGFAMGRTVLETVVSESQVSRVDFLLDGERQAAVGAAPFSATLDLGPLPQPRRVEVVAFDSGGSVLGRDYLILNEGSGTFGVRIVNPQMDQAGTASEPLTGPVDVEAEVEPRRGEGVDRVEFFWKETLVATRFAPPYRQRVMIPAESPKGFVRVVAYLEDGASSEDVVFVNSPGASERLQVNLLELYVVVTDRSGSPVKGLRKEDFRLTEAGERHEIATFSEAGDLPLTVGLAIDSSASMFVKLPRVQFAAAEFIRGLSTSRDRAFVVGFGSEPQLARNTTSDLPRVIQALGGLRPDGRTAIWKAIVYSLVQLQGVPGKKALLVYSDGADEDPDFSFRTCLRFARKVGVPIYVILSNNEIVRTAGRGLNVRSFLGRLETLVDSVGGRLFMARVGEDLDSVYRQIEEELRTQYLLGYYSADAGGKEWRPVAVDVSGSGLKARTIAGYFR